jgi:hypothetical protein
VEKDEERSSTPAFREQGYEEQIVKNRSREK